MKKIKFVTFGCKVNQYETEAICEKLLSLGFVEVKKGETADYIVINSCAVTSEGERKSRQSLRRLRAENPNAVILYTGCVPQAFPEKSDDFIEADIVCGNTSVDKICDLLTEYDGKRVVSIEPHLNGEKYNTPSVCGMSGRTRAYMKIQDGCDRFCSYCIIPYSRGRVRSRSIESIRQEAETLAKGGYKEIVLTGINLSAYGKDTGENFADAVEAAASPEGIARVRLGSLEPDYFNDELLDRLSLIGKLCPQFHLSLQSGCDSTLKRMNRHYDMAFYKELVAKLRARFPHCAITTDIMVGFAGETEEEFEESLSNAKEIGFSKIHVFPYSVRKGTRAERLPGQNSAATKAERSKRMIEVSNISGKNFLNTMVGKIFPVLFERGKSGIFEGTTPNYSRVILRSKEDICGKILNIKITNIEGDSLTGYPV